MNLETAKQALKSYFGYDEFFPLQEKIVQAVLDKKDCLVLMPTGGGKSVCFQIPAIVSEGMGVVVSPLIALMKDQVEGLKANGVKAEFLNSSLSSQEQGVVANLAMNGELDLLYVSPETLLTEHFSTALQRMPVRLFAIDEAHCVSFWGHDFRPEYTKLKFLKQAFPDVPVIALTATADKITRRDILAQLDLQDPELFIASFDRPNLSLKVLPGRNRLQQIIQFVRERPNQPGIIYCLSRKSTESVAASLRAKGFNAGHYHAGMNPGERAKAQEDFIKDNTDIICATIAFGMGIDKSNVRWILHYNMPKNIESYYQEIGRAGRDGADADTLLFYSFGDVIQLRQFIEGDGEHAEVQLAKLERMRQYAEAMACRRKILLSYFGEAYPENCGNCDICKDPPQTIDGTVIAQKALSAVFRLNENVGMTLLIDVLRGSGKREVVANGYNKIKTYGAGADISYGHWQNYLLQLLNQGLIEIAYDQGNTVKLTETSKRVLFEQDKVFLVAPVIRKARLEKEKQKVEKKKTVRERVRGELFEHLRKLRKELADKARIPPYLVFSDATLEQMAAERPANEVAMRNISGVGDRKWQLYGDLFINAILEFIQAEAQKGTRIQGGTYLMTLSLYSQGLSLQEIAEKRELAPSTVAAHFIKLHEEGHEIDLRQHLTTDLAPVADALKAVENPESMKEVFEYLKEEVPYEQIRLAVAILNRENAVSG